jgi:hypothetical protein
MLNTSWRFGCLLYLLHHGPGRPSHHDIGWLCPTSAHPFRSTFLVNIFYFLRLVYHSVHILPLHAIVFLMAQWSPHDSPRATWCQFAGILLMQDYGASPSLNPMLSSHSLSSFIDSDSRQKLPSWLNQHHHQLLSLRLTHLLCHTVARPSTRCIITQYQRPPLSQVMCLWRFPHSNAPAPTRLSPQIAAERRYQYH